MRVRGIKTNGLEKAEFGRVISDSVRHIGIENIEVEKKEKLCSD